MNSKSLVLSLYLWPGSSLTDPALPTLYFAVCIYLSILLADSDNKLYKIKTQHNFGSIECF